MDDTRSHGGVDHLDDATETDEAGRDAAAADATMGSVVGGPVGVAFGGGVGSRGGIVVEDGSMPDEDAPADRVVDEPVHPAERPD
jgi:hypothetical protein